MAEKRHLVAGNWKMNMLRADALGLAGALAARAKGHSLGCDVLVCPPATVLTAVAGVIAGSAVALGGQDCAPAEKGAFTGDISAEMLRDDSVYMADKMKHAGVDVTLEIWPKVFHVWQIMADILPEGRRAMEKIVTFARTRLAQ